jgi:hypothetical protein
MSFRQLKLTFLVPICFALILASCQPAPELTSETLTGIWVFRNDHLRFNQDGTYHSGNTEELDTAEAVDWGTYTFEGTTLTFTSAPDAPFCPGDTGIYELELTSDGLLLFTHIEEEFGPRRSVLTTSQYSKKSP